MAWGGGSVTMNNNKYIIKPNVNMKENEKLSYSVKIAPS